MNTCFAIAVWAGLIGGVQICVAATSTDISEIRMTGEKALGVRFIQEQDNRSRRFFVERFDGETMLTRVEVPGNLFRDLLGRIEGPMRLHQSRRLERCSAEVSLSKGVGTARPAQRVCLDALDVAQREIITHWFSALKYLRR